MITIPGYRITEQIYLGVKTQVWRGIAELDEKPVAIKMLKSEQPSLSEMILFRNQYTIAKNLNLPGVIKHYQLEKYRQTLVLIMEDFGGIALDQYINNEGNIRRNITSNLNDFLQIAIQITNILAGVHQSQIIHKDIKPQNILINPETGQIKLIDFSISSLLPRENQELQNPNRLEGTIAYISPEQTGRMNRGIDYRTDFYSLGITFYELLTGQKPFQSNDIMELIHCHIARPPIPPFKVNPEIPEILSDLILKLIEKNAEDRYQTAFGIKYDLEKCLEQYTNNIRILPFALGSRDISQEFKIPEKLYGRQPEVQALLTAFNRIGQGTTEIMLIAGFSGIGKTAVVNEVHKPIVRQRGYFIKGKYDQFNRDIPFSAWVQAFQNLMRQLLTESKISVQIWQDTILEALGEDGQVIIDVIPELERIIGKQKPAPELEGNAAQNRFNLLFGKFIQVFATKEHPLVIFLDDLQWADGASLQLIKLLVNDVNTNYLLLIGAYRDNEVSPIHPLMLTMDEIVMANNDQQYAKININKITLEPLNENSLNQLISETLFCPHLDALALTELVFIKTKGNPFFSNQFLKSLQVEGLIFFDFSKNYWQYDLVKIRAFSVSDDVVEFMASQLQKLPINTQNVLKLAACIGHSFDLLTLSIAYEKSLTETATDLWKALQEGLVIPTNEVYKLFQDSESEQVAKNLEISIPYKFLHDRVQQAADFLIPENEKPETHLKIGRLLLKKCGRGNTPTATELEEKIFDIVNQLSYGMELITTQSERDELANLNLIAGRKAKNSTAYAAAFEYLTAGIELLDDFSWETHYQLTLGLYEQAVEAAFLCGKFEEIERLSEVVLGEAKTPLDKVKIYDTKIVVSDLKGNLIESINIGLKALKILGINLPKSPTPFDVESAIQQKKACLSESNIGDFINLPIMIDPEKIAALSIINRLVQTSYIANRPLFLLLACQGFELSLKYGNTVLSACAYADFGKIAIGLFKDVESAFELGKLALDLLALLNAKNFKSRALLKIAVFTQHWKYPLRESLSLLQEGYKNALETGDIEQTGFTIFFKLMYSYFSGLELKQLDTEIENYSPVLFKFKQKRALGYYKIFQQVIANLLGKVENPCILSSSNYNEEAALIAFKKVNDKLGIFHFYLNKSILCYMFNDCQQAAENINLAIEYIEGATAMFSIPVYYFYASLIELSFFDNANAAARELIIQKVENYQKQMQHFAIYAPRNHQHKVDLVAAEKHRVLGENLEAIEAYERAIAQAKVSEFLQEEALAYELAAKFYLDWGKKKIANVYFNDAYSAYNRWGASAKTEDLEKCYPDFFGVILVNQFTQAQRETTVSITQKTIVSNNTSNSGFLDLTAVIKASHALSLEINLPQLLSTFMRLLMENAGASKGALILEQSGEFLIEATGISENSEIAVLQSIPLETSYDLPITVINYVARTQASTILNDWQSEILNTQAQIPTINDPYLLQYQPKSVLCTPIINQGKLFGILYLENNLAIGAFTPARLEVLNILSSQAAISIENARLYKSLEDKVNIRTAQLAQANEEIMGLNSRLKAENLRMSAELEVTKRLQQMILPMQSELEAVEGLEIAAFMEAADEVGGDYYDILKHDGKVKISIGDVTGHGLESGVLMIMAQTAIRTLQEVNETNPVTFLNVLNRTLYHNLQRMQSNKNMTLSLLDYQDGVVFLSGQHEYIIVVRANGEVELIDTIDLGFPLGLEENIADFIDQKIVQLNAADVVVLYTDGITEAEDTNRRYYGLERLVQIVQDCYQQSAPQIRQAIIDDVRRHIGKQKVFDDITLLVLKQK
jgi:predicted ATPase/serine phosphatase RsbU (regulator of sigma subunit)